MPHMSALKLPKRRAGWRFRDSALRRIVAKRDNVPLRPFEVTVSTRDTVMSDAEQAKDLWKQVEEAYRGTDERTLWFAWKMAYRARFWKHFDAMGPGQVCAKHNVPYDQLLKRLTAYEMRTDRVSAADEAELLERGAPPSSRRL